MKKEELGKLKSISLSIATLQEAINEAITEEKNIINVLRDEARNPPIKDFVKTVCVSAESLDKLVKSEKFNKINSSMSLLKKVVLNGGDDSSTNISSVAEFQADRISKAEAATIVNVTMPTFDKLVKAGRFKIYNVGHRKYLLRSELLEALKGNL